MIKILLLEKKIRNHFEIETCIYGWMHIWISHWALLYTFSKSFVLSGWRKKFCPLWLEDKVLSSLAGG